MIKFSNMQVYFDFFEVFPLENGGGLKPRCACCEFVDSSQSGGQQPPRNKKAVTTIRNRLIPIVDPEGHDPTTFGL